MGFQFLEVRICRSYQYIMNNKDKVLSFSEVSVTNISSNINDFVEHIKT